MKPIRIAAALAVVFALSGTVVGCTASGYPDPDGERGPEDALPSVTEEMDEYDYSTSLKSASYDGTDLYLVWPSKDGFNTGGAPCLAIVAETSIIACSGGGGGVRGQIAGGPEFALHPAGSDMGEGWKALSENVSVRD